MKKKMGVTHPVGARLVLGEDGPGPWGWRQIWGSQGDAALIRLRPSEER